MTSIFEAAEEGNDKLVREIIKSDPDQIFTRSLSGNTALHCAASQCQLKVCRTLVDLGADVNAVGSDGRTSLHAAAQGGSFKIVQLLLQHGANLEAIDERDQTPLLVAATNVEVGRPESQKLVEFLIQSGAEYDLDTAVLQADTKRVRELLGSGDAYWKTLSQVKQAALVNTALRLKSPDILRLLLEHGADPRIRTTSGYYVYAPIANATNPAMAELLLQHGADPGERDFQGLTLLEKAQKFKLTELEAVLQHHAGTAVVNPGSEIKRSSRTREQSKPESAEAGKDERASQPGKSNDKTKKPKK